jgi:polyvinyl alcohol dehydrogenase (cytochrome)
MFNSSAAVRFVAGMLAALFLASLLPSEAWSADESPPEGQALYEQYCSTCHDHAQGRVPARATIAARSADEVLQALTTGLMRTQAAGLTLNERTALAVFITGKAPSGNLAQPPEANLCAKSATALDLKAPRWNGWGRDLDNSRFQPEPGLTAAEVPRLKLLWAFGYRGSTVYGQPTLVGGRVFVTSVTGRAYSLDARTGCAYWTFDAPAPVRASISIAVVPGMAADKPLAFLGDDSATVYALDAMSGRLVWKTRLDEHPAARITGSPVFSGTRLYVPVSSLEEVSATAPGYECCKFRGSVAALDAKNGRLIWQTYTIDAKAAPYRKAKDGTQLYGPAGGAVWTAPTVDPRRKLLYVGAGNSYTDVPAPRTDSILALRQGDGHIAWVYQFTANDNYVVGCEQGSNGNCPLQLGPDIDPAGSPILRTLPGGGQLLLAGSKSGLVHALEPDSGKQRWEARVGVGSALGGIEWGPAADAKQLYAAVSDVTVADGKGPGGLTAIRVDTGEKVWFAPAPKPTCAWGPRNCTAAQSQAVTAIPGVVFSGSQDGHLRAFATTDGRVIWDVDTAQPVATVNGVPAIGGSLDGGGATVAGGMLYVNSGYGRITGQPGNVLLAYGLER